MRKKAATLSDALSPTVPATQITQIVSRDCFQTAASSLSLPLACLRAGKVLFFRHKACVQHVARQDVVSRTPWTGWRRRTIGDRCQDTVVGCGASGSDERSRVLHTTQGQHICVSSSIPFGHAPIAALASSSVVDGSSTRLPSGKMAQVADVTSAVIGMPASISARLTALIATDNIDPLSSITWTTIEMTARGKLSSRMAGAKVSRMICSYSFSLDAASMTPTSQHADLHVSLAAVILGPDNVLVVPFSSLKHTSIVARSICSLRRCLACPGPYTAASTALLPCDMRADPSARKSAPCSEANGRSSLPARPSRRFMTTIFALA